MWTRRELKAKAKETLHLNYWKTVLVALVFTIVCSGAGVVGTAGGNRASDYAYQPEMTTYEHELSPTEVDQMLEDFDEIDMTDPDNPPIDEITGLVNDYSKPESIVEEISPVHLSPSPAEVFAVAGIVFVIAVVVLAIALTIEAFLANPLEVGTYRFFTRNLNQKAEVKEVAFGFDNNYRETVKTMFWRDIYTLLWGLLLIVPGIVKAYEYRMIPYLLADDPTMTKDRAFAESKRMMSGNKWRAFVLDLSFIGWYLLALPTLGLVTIFYASPYKKMTDAALYEKLRYGQLDLQDNAPLPAPAPTSVAAVPVPPFAAEDAPAPVWDDEDAGSDEA